MFNREINLEHKKYQKDILTDDKNAHKTQHIKSFLVFSCADIYFLKNRSPKASNLVQMAISLF